MREPGAKRMRMHAEQRVRLDDGAETTLERWGEGPTAMLCLHGMTSSRRSWERLAARVGDRFRLYAYDQRGHGDSAGVRGPMTLHRALLDLYNVMTAMPDPVDALVGHSWGGAIAILGGRRFDVKRVVGIDPMLRQAGRAWYDEFLRDVKRQFAAKGDRRAERIRAEYANWDAVDVAGKVHAVAQMSVRTIARLRDENPPEHWDLRRDVEEYPRPLLLAMADAAESIVSRDDLRFAREHGGANVAIRVFEGADHNVHRTNFDRFCAELESFLARTEP